MRKIARIAYRAAVLLLTLLLLLVNARLYFPSAADYSYERLGPDVLPQLRFVRQALAQDAGTDMQELFPEGYFFTHLLYGLAWVEAGLRQAEDAPLRRQALDESRWALARVLEPAGRAQFSSALDPPYGVFYNGWSLWLRGGVLKLEAAAARDPAEVAAFSAACLDLAAAFAANESPFLQAYPGGAWPVDSVVAMAALRLHDSLLPPRFAATIATWLNKAQAHLDPVTGLLPHLVDPDSGALLEGARGSSQSIIARFALEIDEDWGRAQYATFRQHFVDHVLGVAGVREYPLGATGAGDVDSGPLIAGISLSASAVMLGAALTQGDRVLADPLLHESEALGMPVEWGGVKRYAFGVLPVGDAFLAWAKTARPWIASPRDAGLAPVLGGWWQLPLHAVALLLLTAISFPLWRRKTKLWAADRRA